MHWPLSSIMCWLTSNSIVFTVCLSESFEWGDLSVCLHILGPHRLLRGERLVCLWARTKASCLTFCFATKVCAENPVTKFKRQTHIFSYSILYNQSKMQHNTESIPLVYLQLRSLHIGFLSVKIQMH